MTAAASTPPGRTPARSIHLLLALANVAVGMAAFIVIGVLTPVAETFGVPHWQAGWLMTIYAVVYALTSPVLVALTGRHDRRTILCTGLGILAAASIASALAPSFATMLASRALMAIGAGIVTPVATAIAVATAAPEHRGRALAIVFGGFTIAQAFGVPAGVWLGYQFGWRIAFGIVAALALVCTLVLRQLVPKGISVQPTSLATLAGILRTPVLLLAVSFTACFMASAFTVYTYLAPFLQSRYGFGQTGITAMLLIFGFGGIAGNMLGGFLTDRIGPVHALTTLSVAMICVLPLLTLLHVPPIAVGIMVAIWSVIGWSVNVPQQARLAALDPARAPVLLALHASAIYVGTSIGSALGGQTIAAAGYDLLGLAAVVPAAIGLASILLVAAMHRRTAAARP